MSFGLQTLSDRARIAGLGLLYSPAMHSLMLSVCSLKRLASEERKRWERGGSKVKEADRKILGRLEHVKLCNVHLRGSGADFKPNHFKSLIYN